MIVHINLILLYRLQKNRRTFQKLEKTVNPEELQQTLGFMQKKQKYEFLEKAFQEELELYRHVIRRITS